MLETEHQNVATNKISKYIFDTYLWFLFSWVFFPSFGILWWFVSVNWPLFPFACHLERLSFWQYMNTMNYITSETFASIPPELVPDLQRMLSYNESSRPSAMDFTGIGYSLFTGWIVVLHMFKGPMSNAFCALHVLKYVAHGKTVLVGFYISSHQRTFYICKVGLCSFYPPSFLK